MISFPAISTLPRYSAAPPPSAPPASPPAAQPPAASPAAPAKDAEWNEIKNLFKSTKVPVAIGTLAGAAGGAALGSVGGAIGGIVGSFLRYSTATLGAVGIGMCVGAYCWNKWKHDDGAKQVLGTALFGLVGMVAGGVGGALGGTVLGAAAGAAGGVLGGVAGALSVGPIAGFAAGTLKLGAELKYHPEKYPTLVKHMEEEAAKKPTP